jgi:thiamine biosynthesis lipoprotein
MCTGTNNYQYHSVLKLFHGSVSGIMGTRFDILLPTDRKSAAEKVWTDILSLLDRLDKMLNRFNPQSEISKINSEAQQKPISITPEMLKILQLCADYHHKTFGYFDITLRDFSKVHIDQKAMTVYFLEEIKLDLGGFAKGYAMTFIEQMLINKKIRNAFIDFGNSSITALGHHPHGDCWKVSIPNPFDNGKILREIELRNASMSTSGNTPTYDEHIINPFSGKYINEKKLMCIVAPNALDAEILTTALMAAPDAEKEKILRNFAIERKIEYTL